MAKIKIGVHGASGVIGKLLIEKINSSDFCIPCYPYSKNCKTFNSIDDLFLSSDVVIDFSIADAIDNLLLVASRYNKPLVIGTSGLSSEQKNKIKEISNKIPVLYSSNFSIGANVARIASGIISDMLREKNFEVGIFEMHKKTKKDSPSGTSLMIEEEIKNKSGLDVTHSSMRIANTIGEHSVIFENIDESLRIVHSVSDRGVFAIGALKSALWLVKKDVGLYTMDDFLFNDVMPKK